YKEDHSFVISNTLGKKKDIDSIGQILQKRYKLIYSDIWISFFNNDYDHANFILYHAEISFDKDRNAWTNYMDSFNDIVIRKFIDFIKNTCSNVKCPSLLAKDGKQINIGTILDSQHQILERRRSVVNSRGP
ncbi:hypothetical protein MBAV_006067, partial [Candidatus Magnetobacterium bavaricum]